MPGTISKFLLWSHTSDQDYADSLDQVRVFSGATEIGSFGKPGGKGYVDLSLPLGVSGTDAWKPRAAFLMGQLAAEGDKKGAFVPLAHSFGMPLQGWISQDIDEGIDRWELIRVAPAAPDFPLTNLILCVNGGWSDASASRGPIEFSLFGRADGLPVLVYHTQLP